MDSHVPEDANEGCPGVNTASAGHAESCRGCPNQAACASGTAKPTGGDPAVAARLSRVKHKLLVLSGKGGVGKSTVSTQIAFGLAARGFEVGLLDLDLCGPSIPRTTGLEGAEVHRSGQGWSPVYARDNLAVVSIGFLLPGTDDPVIWRGPKKNGLIRQFLADVDWEELDFLVIDTPPGTSDEHISVVQYLGMSTEVDGAVLVTTSQQLSVGDVRKEFGFCIKTGVRVLGVVENMCEFICEHCGKGNALFCQPESSGVRKMVEDFGSEVCARVSFSRQLLMLSEGGGSVFEVDEDTSLRAIRREFDLLIDQILIKVNAAAPTP